MWSYLIAEKSEAFQKFKDFKASVEKESGVSVCCLRTDRGGEFCSKEFDEFCRDHGIKRQLTAAYTPQQNGVVERRNQTIMNLVRSTLSERKMPKEFWAEGVKWITYVLNRSPTNTLQDQTPEEVWSGIKPNVKHFRVFGCIGHVHVPEAKRTKLDNKSCKCVFLGVSEKSKAYRMFNPISKKITVSRDVIFEEEENWDWGRNESEEVQNQSNVLTWENDGDNMEGEEEYLEEEEIGDPEVEHEADAVAATNGEVAVSGSGSSRVTQERPVRARAPPTYLRDYECGEAATLTDEEIAAYVDNDYLLDDHVLQVVTALGDPTTYEEAVRYGEWREAMNAEIESIERNQTWELSEIPKGTKTIGVK